ncbi:MAG: thermonuclease family protein [Thiobacillus sp.]
MKRWLQVGLFVAVWAFALPTLAETLRGVVIVVIDGDTVLFKPDQYGAQSRAFLKIRLADIDAPEKDQAYGDTATRTLKALVLNQPVEINMVATDAYGRKIAHLQVGALRINTEMVRLGLAWSSSRYQRNVEGLAAQDEARRALRGLWVEAAPSPPWVWRRAQKASD